MGEDQSSLKQQVQNLTEVTKLFLQVYRSTASFVESYLNFEAFAVIRHQSWTRDVFHVRSKQSQIPIS